MKGRVPRVVGLDFSLTSTGVAWSHLGDTMSIKPKATGHERLDQIFEAVAEAARGCDLAVIETPSYRSASQTFHQLAGGWWIGAHAVWRVGVPYAQVAPATLKLYATGDGDAKRVDKKAMLAAARRAWPGVRFGTDDEADAMFLAAMGAAHLGRPVLRVTPRQLGALTTAKWPPLPARTRAA